MILASRILVRSGRRLANIPPYRCSSSSSGDKLLNERSNDDQICRLTLNDPKKRNALSFELLEALKSAIIGEMKKNDKLRVFVLAASPPAFSAGHDLKELRSEVGMTKHAKIFKVCTEVMKLIQDIPYPFIGVVDGVAAAAGCQLAASCDIVVASNRSQFSVPGIKAGLFCSTPGVAVSRAVPRKVAMDMLLTGTTIDAHAALRGGLVSRVVVPEKLQDEVASICNTICCYSAPVVGLGKGFFYGQIESDRNTAYRFAEQVMIENLRLKDCQNGIDAFLKKQIPQWTHTTDKTH